MTYAEGVVKHFELNTGHKIPSLGLGVYESAGQQCKEAILGAIRTGYRLIDTAQFYGNEHIVGEAIRECGVPRDELFVTTKVYNCFSSKEELLKYIKKSYDALDIGYIDLFLMHTPLPGKDLRVSTWNLMCELRKEDQMVRSFGVSNFGVAHLQQLKDAQLPPPCVNQIELHPHLPQTRIVNYCKEHGILVQAYCPLMRGANSEQSLGEGAAWAGKPGFGWTHQALVNTAKKHKKTIAQILLRWSLQKGYSPQPKSISLNRILENYTVWDFELSSEEMEVLDRMSLENDINFTGKRIELEWNPVKRA